MTAPAESDAIRVACVGDSITRGTFAWRRRKNAYPAQLQAMLGERFCVRNFGVNGHAAQCSADRPYWNSAAFASSAAFRPDIVLIMLGTNDSRGDNWKGIEPFARDYRDLVEHYRSLESDPAVWLLTPPTLFRVRRARRVYYDMDERAVREMCRAIEGLASDLGCGFIDVNGVTADHPEAFRFDGVHPGAAGQTLIARAVSEALAIGLAADPR
ncbi:MAG: GDSL-type esterase/lipase family protein [Anaerosomatales bacterium]|nr:GDSL-type esterase/lipase family protein [Anaerosomatales bacterium]MDT8434573.1 GDSL-type esterase/lipase family protein [Anaerosomatales bacterium]